LTEKTQNKKLNRPQLQLIKPKTPNQNKIFKEFNKGNHVFIHGSAGTGKTYIALYLALYAVLVEKKYNEIIIVRSTVPSRKQGYLPGNDEEKNEVYELPYDANVNELFNESSMNMYKTLKSEKKLRFLSTSYLRGLTFRNAVIIVDEIQNFGPGEADTVVTRTGDNCQLIIAGDTKQNDLLYLREESCIDDIRKIVEKMPSFSLIEMSVNDIQRDGIVKEWILARDGISNTMPRFLTR
jgi:predicted ribonuclease YlaK